MERHVIIGTAGHIDHGKTTLIKALTGRDTDRLKEEKARGITIDLGFTWMDLTDGERVGIIDVPGHEKFISNMTAGVVGMDLVLLVIAADEGVMPQTREHLAILRLLGVENILVVLNKCDLVDEEWLEMVEQQICEEMQQLLTVGQRNDQVEDKLEYNVDIVRVSAKSGAGIEELRNQKYDNIKNKTVTINLADLLDELAKLTKIKPEVNLIVEMPITDFRKYSEENIEGTFDQFDRLNCNITIKLDNYRKYFNSNNEFTFCLAYIHLMKRDENSKDDCLLRLFKENNLLGKSIQINYDLDKVLIELPVYYVFEYDIIKQAVINCLQRPEPKIKHKILNK